MGEPGPPAMEWWSTGVLV